MRVLFVANDPSGHAVYRYRCENFARVLSHAGHTAEVVYVGQARVRVDHDVVVLHRICRNGEGRAFARAARACGAALVYSTDDLVFDANAFTLNTPLHHRFRTFAPLHHAMLREADAAIASTEFLARAMRAASAKPVFTLRNFLSKELAQLSFAATRQAVEDERDTITLAYLSGSATHDADFALIAPALAEILAAHSNTHLLLVGPVALPPVLKAFSSRIHRQPFVVWRELPGVLAGVDINLAPLAPGVFGDAKSEIKFLEAAALGIPTLASPRAGFCEFLGVNSEFIASSVEAWSDKLAGWITDAEGRRDAGKRACEVTLERGTEPACVASVVSAFGEIVALRKTQNAKATARWVNWPVAPKHVVKGALARAKSAARSAG